MRTVYWAISILLTISMIAEIILRREFDYTSIIAIAVNFWGYQICKRMDNPSTTVNVTGSEIIKIYGKQEDDVS